MEVQSIFKSPIDVWFLTEPVFQDSRQKQMNFSINDYGSLGYPQANKVLAHNYQSQGDSSCIEDYFETQITKLLEDERGSYSVLMWGKDSQGKRECKVIKVFGL